MDFDSPDVAKEFPGLARAMSDATEYDDWEKSKKKKDKKDSKKDKDKGYATLADSPDEEEGVTSESKSPGKGMKIKAFKLSSKKKDRKDSVKKSQEQSKTVTSQPEVSTKICNTSIVKEQGTSPSASLSSGSSTLSAPLANPPVTNQTEKIIQRRPFDGQGYRHSLPAIVGNSKIKVKDKSGNEGSKGSKGSVSAVDQQTSEKKGLNVFLNAPVPMLLKKKDSKEKEKESKKEHSLSSAAKVKLKLKRGSKSSLDEGSTGSHEVIRPKSPSHPQLPEDPESISKEIRKYEEMLEVAHAQIKSGKKQSKKHEDQLWELQRMLTQLKRKLRSINALSATFHAVTATAVQPQSSSVTTAVVEGKSEKSPAHTLENTKSSPLPQATIVESSVISHQGDLNIPELDEVPVDLTPNEKSTDEKTSSTETLDDPGIKLSKDLHPSDEIKEMPEEANEFKTVIQLNPSPENVESLQVQVEVHCSILQENPTPEDINQEIQSFDTTPPGVQGGKREYVNIIEKAKLLPTDSPTEAINELGSSTADPVAVNERCVPRKSEDLEKEEVYVTLNTYPTQIQSNSDQNDDQEGGSEQGLQPELSINQPTSNNALPSIFDPFALPDFKSDEFIAAENDALILFNQQLQEEIVQEEEEIARLLEQIQKVMTEKDLTDNIGDTTERIPSSEMEDLMGLDDDELVAVWQIVRGENDTLNEQVVNLKTMVAKSRLEEFRLETRLKYLLQKQKQV